MIFETPFTRRQMKDVVQRHLLPWAWQREDCPTAAITLAPPPHKHLLWLQPPLHLPPEIPVTERLVDVKQMRRGKPVPGRGSFDCQILWPELGLHCLPFAWLGFLFQGEIDLRIGASRNLRVGPEGEGKIHIITLKAPTFFVIPPGVPHPDGHQIPWERPLHLLREEPLIFWVHVSPSGLRCHLSRLAQGRYQEEFFVLLNNEVLMGLAKLLLTEMQRACPFPLVIEAALLSLALEIDRSLCEEERPDTTENRVSTDNLSLLESQSALHSSQSTLTANAVTIEAAKRFIEIHLNWRTLCLEMVAHNTYVSTSHLNRLFKAELGLTVKAYIQKQRINIAKALLRESDIPIAEVGFLSGFFPPSHFARAFSQAESITPKKFRDSHRHADAESHL